MSEMSDSSTDSRPRVITRPVKACTNCRQQKIRCDAAVTQPAPCSRCAKMHKECIIDPLFRPRKGGQVELLRQDIRRLQDQIDHMHGPGEGPDGLEDAHTIKAEDSDRSAASKRGSEREGEREPSSDYEEPTRSKVPRVSYVQQSPRTSVASVSDTGMDGKLELEGESLPSQETAPLHMGPFVLEDITMSLDQARRLHRRFVSEYLEYIPIIETHSAEELYGQSEMLFWTIMTTAALSEPSPELYLKMIDPIKRLVMSVSWINTPRSTHVVQALLVLSSWPLPNEKVLDDPSYRYVNLARCLGLQLGMHRGKFIYEFSRKQKLMPNAVKWRTRTWIATFVNEQFLSASLGVPSNMQVDYLVDQAATKPDYIPGDYQGVLKLAIYYGKMVTVMGSSISTSDGLLDAKMRSPTLDILSHNLSTLKESLPLHDPYVEIVFQYVRCMLCCFAFLPETPEEDQPPFVVEVFHAATRLITIMRTLVGKRRITEFPGIIRQASSFAALVLFRLHVMKQFPSKYVESARQSIVTVHHLYRNVAPAWRDVQNDVTRIAKLLESLNYVLVTRPYILTSSRQIISRMRSHLTYSIFYELIWAIHESRRKNTKASKNGTQSLPLPKPLIGPEEPQNEPKPRVQPLPLFNQINTDDYTTNTFTSPNGTTMTMLVPTAVSSPRQGDTSRGPSRVASRTDLAQLNLNAPIPPLMPLAAGPSLGGPGLAPLQGLAPVDFNTNVDPADPLQLDAILQGIDWMNHEGDDFLGWIPTANDFPL